MTDIALRLVGDQATSDLSLQGGDLALDGTLYTAVLLSLLCDRLADADDVIPDGSTNRRGWWFDAYASPLPDGTPDLSGSKLWLRTRSLATQQTALQIQSDCEEALAWMTATGVANDVEVSTQFVSENAIKVLISIDRQSATGTPYNYNCALLWDRTLGLLPANVTAQGADAAPVPAALGLGPIGLSPPSILPLGPGVIYSNGLSLGIADITDGLEFDFDTTTLQAVSVTWSQMPVEAGSFPMLMSIGGSIPAGERFLFSLPQPYVIPANFGATTAAFDLAASNAAVFAFSIKSGGQEIELGTITLGPGNAVQFSQQAAYANQVADALVLTTPSPADPTLAGVAFGFMLQRI